MHMPKQNSLSSIKLRNQHEVIVVDSNQDVLFWRHSCVDRTKTTLKFFKHQFWSFDYQRRTEGWSTSFFSDGNVYYFVIFNVSSKELFWSIKEIFNFMREYLQISIYRNFQVFTTLKLNDILSFFLIKFCQLIPIYKRTGIIKKKNNFNITFIPIKRLCPLLIPLKRVLKTSYEFMLTLLTILFLSSN